MYVAQKTIVADGRKPRERHSMSHHRGYIAILCSAILFGVSVTVNKMLLESVSPVMIAPVSYIVAGL